MAKSKWDEVAGKLILVEAWARDGCTDATIAKKLDISKDTFYKYKAAHVDFSDALKRGKEIVDIEVENALLKRATGYTQTAQKAFQFQGSVVIAEVVENVAPDVGAIAIWLKNRKPDTWRDKPKDESNPDNGLMAEYVRLLKKRDENA